MDWTQMIGVIVDGLLRRGEFLLYKEEVGDRVNIHPISYFNMYSAEDGSIFYQVTLQQTQRHLAEEIYGQKDNDGNIYIPQRNCVHGVYEKDPNNLLRALNPLMAYANSVGLGSALRAGQEAFHNNKGQPSGIITTDQVLTADQATRLRDRWNEMSQRMKQGDTPILSNGLKWMPVSVSANESQVIQMLGMTTKDIAKAFGIPPIMLGENSGVTYSNLEQLLYSWRTTGLLSLCKIIEGAFEYSFDLTNNEEMVIDMADLARAEALEQADTLTRLVQNGLISPNEARARLDLRPMEGVADGLVAQQQIVPLQQSADINAARAEAQNQRDIEQARYFTAQAEAKPKEVENAAAKPAPAPAAKPVPSTPSKPTEPEEEKSLDLDNLGLMLKGIFK
jgi:HK97 family phage portal protein